MVEKATRRFLEHSLLLLTLGDEGDFMRISSNSKKLITME